MYKNNTFLSIKVNMNRPIVVAQYELGPKGSFANSDATQRLNPSITSN